MKTVILSVSLLFAIASGLAAKTIKYPEVDPVFSFTLPDDWTTKPSGKGGKGLECRAGDGSNYTFLLRPIEPTTEENVKIGMVELISTLENPDWKNFKVGKVEEMMAGKMKVLVCAATGTLSGDPALVTMRAFAPKKGTYFATMSVAFEKTEVAHRDAMREILSSITPVSAEGGR